MECYPNLNDYNNIHFVGIGGVSMSSLALILSESGKLVTGSDSTESATTELLQQRGIKVYLEHNEKNVSNTELLVYTAAISDNNPELVYAKKNKIPMIERAVLLGILMSTYKHSIAVSGTHGKTTTTSMISSVLLSDEKYDPTILVGAHFNQIKGNYKTGKSDYAVYEACEYVNSFLHFYPETAVILNIDTDHLDFFKDLDGIKKSFSMFTENINIDGHAIINGDDINCKEVIEKCTRKITTFGFSTENDCYAENIRYEMGLPVFDAVYHDMTIKNIKLSVIGKHNILNALATICVAKIYNISKTAILTGLYNFKGANRRFEIKKHINDAAIVDDYAHHPTEIKATISSAKSAGYKKTTVIFQPHTYTRTKLLIHEFAKELSNADKVILTDIYSAREINTIGANIIDLKNMIPNCEYISDFTEIAAYIKKNANPNELFILMGAGNINLVVNLL